MSKMIAIDDAVDLIMKTAFAQGVWKNVNPEEIENVKRKWTNAFERFAEIRKKEAEDMLKLYSSVKN
jgi:hypothetical protein